MVCIVNRNEDLTCLAAVVTGTVCKEREEDVGGVLHVVGKHALQLLNVWTAMALTPRPAWTPCAPPSRSVSPKRLYPQTHGRHVCSVHLWAQSVGWRCTQ